MRHFLERGDMSNTRSGCFLIEWGSWIVGYVLFMLIMTYCLVFTTISNENFFHFVGFMKLSAIWSIAAAILMVFAVKNVRARNERRSVAWVTAVACAVFALITFGGWCFFTIPGIIMTINEWLT